MRKKVDLASVPQGSEYSGNIISSCFFVLRLQGSDEVPPGRLLGSLALFLARQKTKSKEKKKKKKTSTGDAAVEQEGVRRRGRRRCVLVCVACVAWCV